MVKIYSKTTEDEALSAEIAKSREAKCLQALRDNDNIINLISEEHNALLVEGDEKIECCYITTEYLPESVTLH